MSIEASGYHGKCDGKGCGKRVAENSLTEAFARKTMKRFGFTRPIIDGVVLDLCPDCDHRAQVLNRGPLTYEELPGGISDE